MRFDIAYTAELNALMEGTVRRVLALYLTRYGLEELIPALDEATPDHVITIAGLNPLDVEDIGEVAGGCWFTGADDSREARQWIIALSPDTESYGDGAIMVSLIHEAVHLGQYLTDVLRTVKTGGDYSDASNWWMGVLSEGVSYEDQPWELEAYELQDTYASMLVDDPSWYSLLLALVNKTS